MLGRRVVTRRVTPALAIVLAVLSVTGCPVMFTISPGGTFSVDSYAGGDVEPPYSFPSVSTSLRQNPAKCLHRVGLMRGVSGVCPLVRRHLSDVGAVRR